MIFQFLKRALGIDVLITRSEATMASLDDVKAKIAELGAAVAAEAGQVKAAIQSLKDQLEAGAAVTPADLDGLITQLSSIEDGVKGIIIPDGPIANSGGGPDDGGNGP